MAHKIIVSFLVLILFVTSVFCGVEEFDLSDISIDVNDFVGGGPAKDGIPAIFRPKFISPLKATFLNGDDLVIGVSMGQQAKAYPLKIMNWHEIVNDHIDKVSIVVTWCPLTRSAIVFERTLDGKDLKFGVSGLLYKSNLVMYDRNYSGLWPQLQLGAVSGKFSKRRLTIVPSIVTMWETWKGLHPRTRVLSKKTGFSRSYYKDPYARYQKSMRVMFDTGHEDMRLSQKSLVLGVRINGTAKAYPLKKINGVGKPFTDIIAGVEITIHPGPDNVAYSTDLQGNILPAIITYWFAWSAYNEDTLIYKGS